MSERMNGAVRDAENSNAANSRAAAGGRAASAAARAAERSRRIADADDSIFSHVARLIFCIFDVILLCWIETAAAEGYILPVYISINENITMFLAVDLGLLVLAGLLCLPELGRGTAAFFSFRSDRRSLAFTAFAAAAADDIFLILNPSFFVKKGVMIYSAAAAAVLLFALWADTADLRRRRNSLRAVAEGSQSYSVRCLSDDDGELMHPVREFLPLPDEDEAPTPLDSAARTLSPILVITALTLLAIGLMLDSGPYAAMSSFTAVCCLGSPMMFGFGAAFSWAKSSRRLRKSEAYAADSFTVASIAAQTRLRADADIVFPPETVAVHAIKPLGSGGVEQSVIDAASLADAAGGPLRHALTALIDQGRVRVDNIKGLKYIDEMGLEGVSGGRELLFGTRELMRQRGIDLPSREYEARYAAQGRDILYLASSGRLEALFVVGYYPDKNIISSLRKLERSGIDVSIVTPDPNITPSMLADKMGEDRSRIEIEGADLTDRGRAAACAGEDTGLVFSGSIASCEAAVTACRRLNGAFHVFTAVGIVQAVFAGALTAYCAFAAGMTLLTPVAALEFQAIMSLPVFLVSLFRKN